ncbi:MAG: hypothetical protein IPN29_21155 [Saprospiraceae bacterium]|nr:hypothetical protein [Saprospiraceae bacterium]
MNFVTIFVHRVAVVKNIAKIGFVFDTRGGLHPPLPRSRTYGAINYEIYFSKRDEPAAKGVSQNGAIKFNVNM